MKPSPTCRSLKLMGRASACASAELTCGCGVDVLSGHPSLSRDREHCSFSRSSGVLAAVQRLEAKDVLVESSNAAHDVAELVVLCGSRRGRWVCSIDLEVRVQTSDLRRHYPRGLRRAQEPRNSTLVNPQREAARGSERRMKLAMAKTPCRDSLRKPCRVPYIHRACKALSSTSG